MQGPDSTPSLLIIGASVRAALESARRADLCARGADLFADVDAVQQAEVIRVQDYPHGLLHVVQDTHATDVIYTGGLENYPQLVAELARCVHLWGNSAETLQAVRSPDQLTRAWVDAEIPHPNISLTAPAQGQGQWLQKSCNSTAGSGVTWWQPGTPLPPRSYVQQFIPGMSCAAIYVAANRDCHLLGVSEQLIQRPWTGARPFGYAGSIGPLPLPPSVQTQFRLIGQCLTERFHLSGLFGVDAILQDQTVYPVEVNPRYTASVEVWERATGLAALKWHQQAFQQPPLDVKPLRTSGTPSRSYLYGKAILFAERDYRISAALVEHLNSERLDCGSRAYSDLPQPGEHIRQTHPVATVWARAASCREVEHLLQRRVTELRAQLAATHSPPNH